MHRLRSIVGREWAVSFSWVQQYSYSSTGNPCHLIRPMQPKGLQVEKKPGPCNFPDAGPPHSRFTALQVYPVQIRLLLCTSDGGIYPKPYLDDQDLNPTSLKNPPLYARVL